MIERRLTLIRNADIFNSRVLGDSARKADIRT